MFVWLHTQSPPQHVAHVSEVTVSTAAKLADYAQFMAQTRGVSIAWAGVFEGEGAELRVSLFTDEAKARAYVQRNGAPIISTDDAMVSA